MTPTKPSPMVPLRGLVRGFIPSFPRQDMRTPVHIAETRFRGRLSGRAEDGMGILEDFGVTYMLIFHIRAAEGGWGGAGSLFRARSCFLLLV